MRFTRDRYIKHLLKHGYHLLGSGCYSQVFGKPGSDRVIKVNTRPDDWLDYVLWGAKAGYAGTFTPKVYSYRVLGDFTYIAVVERMAMTVDEMRPTEPLARDWWDIRRTITQQGDSQEKQNAETLVPGISKFGRELCNHLRGSLYLDLHTGNAMLRHDGSLCITDPVATDDSAYGTSYPKRMKARDLEALRMGVC